MTVDLRLADEQLEQLADLIADKLAARSDGQLIDASELAERIGRTREFVYEHANELGAIRLGNGSKPRLMFPWPITSIETPQPSSTTANTTRRRRSAAAVDLLPIKGSRRP